MSWNLMEKNWIDTTKRFDSDPQIILYFPLIEAAFRLKLMKSP